MEPAEIKPDMTGRSGDALSLCDVCSWCSPAVTWYAGVVSTLFLISETRRLFRIGAKVESHLEKAETGPTGQDEVKTHEDAARLLSN